MPIITDRRRTAASLDAPARPDRRGSAMADLLLAVALTVVAACAAWLVPAGSLVRLLLVLPILFVVPGYLLVQASLPRSPATSRPLHAVLGVGLSPPIVGLLALATAIVPGGFRPAAIIATVTASCLIFAGVAAMRRLAGPNPSRQPSASAAGALASEQPVPVPAEN